MTDENTPRARVRGVPFRPIGCSTTSSCGSTRRRPGIEIKFEASAGERNVDMRLSWRPESGTWRFVWGFQPVGGQWQAVTDLVLTRAK